MINSTSVTTERKLIYYGIIAAIAILIVCVMFISMFYNNLRQKEILNITERYMTFESKVKLLIHSNISLLQGFEAFIRVCPDINEENTYDYLDKLITDNATYIRNVAIIKDTTILWNYPKETNAAAIGLDLAEVKEQRSSVLKVKSEMIPVFQGPINLVQGGRGFSVRVPIIMNDTGYWGHISIVLKSDKLLEEIQKLAQNAELKISISNNDDNNNNIVFLGPDPPPGDSALTYVMDPSFINWKVYVDVSEVNPGLPLIFQGFTVLSLVISALCGLFVHRYLCNVNKLRRMSNRDFLTGLYNRHFLNAYQGIALSAAMRNGGKAGILIMDLNDFKKTNDTYGHITGDKVLIETSRIISNNIRAKEAAFRFGGDEFLIILPEIEDEKNIITLVERLTLCFDEGFYINDNLFKLTFCSGYSIYPDDGRDMDSLLRIADEHLYREKEHKGGKPAREC